MKHYEDNFLMDCIKWVDAYFAANYPKYTVTRAEKDGTISKIAPAIHIANERATTPQAGARLKRKGVRAGFPDLFFALPTPIYIELKTEKGYLSENQNNWRKYIEITGENYFVCRSLKEFQYYVKAHMETMIFLGEII
jgi:hypothetical protein